MRHTEHCLKRQLWGDGECECGLFEDYKQCEKDRDAAQASLKEIRRKVEIERSKYYLTSTDGTGKTGRTSRKITRAIESILTIIDGEVETVSDGYRDHLVAKEQKKREHLDRRVASLQARIKELEDQLRSEEAKAIGYHARIVQLEEDRKLEAEKLREDVARLRGRLARFCKHCAEIEDDNGQGHGD